MSAQSSAGIKTLLEAEKEAQAIVQKARNYRIQRLKAAKSEAVKEVEAYRKQKEDEFKKFEQEHTGNNTKLEKEAEKEAIEAKKNIATLATKSSDKVIQSIVDSVTTPKPTLHINAS